MIQDQTSIHLRPTSIEVETIKDGVRSIKPTSLQALQEVLSRGDRIETPLLPSQWGVQKYTRINNREQFVISVPERRYTSSYDMRGETGDREAKPFEMVAPPTLWLIYTEINPADDSRRYVHGNAYALKQPILTLNDAVFRFPFSNVSEGFVCWGDGSDYPMLSQAKSIQSIPDRFFANPFNSDLDNQKFSSFQSKINGRSLIVERTFHLLRHMDERIKEADKAGEEFKFDKDILIRTHTVEQVIRQGQQNYMER